MKCASCGWTMLPPQCQNPDCTQGNKKRRPQFLPPLRTSRGHGPGARVRTYQASGDVTLENWREQGRDAGWDNYTTEDCRREWAAMTPAERARVEAELRGWDDAPERVQQVIERGLERLNDG